MVENFLKKMAEQPPLTPDPLVRKIYNLLEENIITMTLPPESRLAEENIARVLGVSRSPVREALMQLENAGLVVRKAGKGRVVAGFTEREIIDNYQVWEMIESFAGGLACLAASEEDFRRIAEVLAKMKGLSGSEQDLRLYRELNYTFHSLMIAPCENKALVRMFENALKPIKWCWNLSILWQQDLDRSYAEHEGMLQAYKDRQRQRYETLVRRHIRDASERFLGEYARRKAAGEQDLNGN